MVAENLHDLLIASVGASASFIGLLFVALTLVLSRLPEGSALRSRERVLASSSYTALVTIFFISMVSLIPGANVAWVLVAMGWLGTITSLRLGRAQQSTHANQPERESLAVVSSLTLMYLALAVFGIYSATQPGAEINSGVLFAILFVLYAAALNRAWALTGVEFPHSGKRD